MNKLAVSIFSYISGAHIADVMFETRPIINDIIDLNGVEYRVEEVKHVIWNEQLDHLPVRCSVTRHT